MTPSTSPTPINSGFIVLHANRSEELAQRLMTWLGWHPLAPLKEEVILVQTIGPGDPSRVWPIPAPRQALDPLQLFRPKRQIGQPRHSGCAVVAVAMFKAADEVDTQALGASPIQV